MAHRLVSVKRHACRLYIHQYLGRLNSGIPRHSATIGHDIHTLLLTDPNDEEMVILKLVEAWDCEPEFIMSPEVQEMYDKPYLQQRWKGVCC